MTPYMGHPYYTVRLTNGLLMEVSVDDMFVMKDLNPLDPFKRGLGQSEALADEIETDEYAAKFQKRFFFNDATPNLVIGMPKSTPEQRQRFRAEWLERFRGMFQSHGVATVNGDVTVNKVGDTMKDMDMVNGRTFLRNAVLEHFGVPREIMGITESSNRATSEAAQFIYAQNVLMPNLRDGKRPSTTSSSRTLGMTWYGDSMTSSPGTRSLTRPWASTAGTLAYSPRMRPARSWVCLRPWWAATSTRRSSPTSTSGRMMTLWRSPRRQPTSSMQRAHHRLRRAESRILR